MYVLPDRSVFLGRCFQLCPAEETNTLLPLHWGSPAVLHRTLRIWQASPPGRWEAGCVICFRQTHEQAFPPQLRLSDHTERSFVFLRMSFLLCWRVGVVVPNICWHYLHETPSGRRSHTCHMSAWDSRCFAPPPRSGHARLWWDRSLRWPEWLPWYFLTRRSPQWSKARSKRGFIAETTETVFNTGKLISGSTRITEGCLKILPERLCSQRNSLPYLEIEV